MVMKNHRLRNTVMTVTWRTFLWDNGKLTPM